jgi:quinol monooxygenase YgiN
VSELQGVGRITIDEGQLDEFKRICAQILEIVRTKDTGTLQFEVYLSDDESEAIVLERYRDSEALLEHAANIGDFGSAIQATGSVTSVMLGEPGPNLRTMLAGGPVQIFTPFASM